MSGNTDYDASPFVPENSDLAALRRAAAGCRGCPLWAHATQTVFGAGPTGASMVLIGEQPGDQEDQAGSPFVGPAGALLDRCLEDAGIRRDQVFVTNAVKHFKWEPRGKRRIHSKPSTREVRACSPWLEAELGQVRPRAVICLGATAAQAILGSGFRLTHHRGELLASEFAPLVLATIHPSVILRQRDDEARRRERESLTQDLRFMREAVARITSQAGVIRNK